MKAKRCQFAAEQWLMAALPPEGKPQEELLREAQAQGHSARTLYRAKAALGIPSRHCGYGRGSAWFWVWPKRKRQGRKAAIIPVEIGQKALRKQKKERGFDVAV